MFKKIIPAVLALPIFLSGPTDANAADFGEYKIRIHVTNAEKIKAKWLCNESDGSTSLIDADIYPASTKTTRTTKITKDKCSTGDWKVRFEIKAWGKWKRLEPGSNVCLTDSCGYTNNGGFSYKTYARPADFNDNGKLCAIGYNGSFEKIYIGKDAC